MKPVVPTKAEEKRDFIVDDFILFLFFVPCKQKLYIFGGVIQSGRNSN
jgi:hypothetical protein